MRNIDGLKLGQGWNKGVYGEKVKNFKAGLPNACHRHGIHMDWVYYEKNHMCACRRCRNERTRVYQSDPSKRLERILRDAKRHAKVGGRICDITIGDLYEILEQQKHKCAISGIVFAEGNGLGGYSLDRIDSSLGYTKTNIQLVTVMVNVMKSNYGQGEFISICRRIALHSAGKSKKK